MTPLWLDEIEKEAGTFRVLLVEGSEDVKIISNFLNRLPSVNGWPTKFKIHPAGRKEHVLVGLRNHSDWIGIVDKDEWGESRVCQEVVNLPNLQPLPRFCIESCFCDPVELWQMLPDSQRSHISGELTLIENPVLTALPAWRQHGALWRVLHNLYRNTRFPSDLEDRPVGNEQEIRMRLEQWHQQLSPDVIIQSYNEEFVRSSQLEHNDCLRTYVHGKKFFHEVVVQQLNRLFGQKSADTWMDEFSTSNAAIPEDLSSFLTRIVQGFTEPTTGIVNA